MSQVKLRSFMGKILYFNGLYRLPIAPYPSVAFLKDSKGELELVSERLVKFQHVLEEECDEIEKVKEVAANCEEPIDFLVELADLLGDICVYCHSEAAKYGIPLDEVLSIIMDSNFSKLDTNGQPIYDECGKVQKGPFYWKPEPKIKELLQERINDSKA